jgi:hypothetical protein
MVAYRVITRLLSSVQLSAVFSGSEDIERLYRKQIHQILQARHLFSDYFPLDEILISPKIVAPPPPMIPGEENIEPSILHQTLSYTPGSPEFPTEYQAPSLTLVEALSTGLDICLMGKAGYGKTTALVEAALSILKGRTQFPDLSEKLPFLIQAQHILAQFPNSNIQEILQKALAADLSSTTQTDFSSLLFSSLQSGTCLLLLDDLGSLPKNDLDRVVNFIRVLKIQYPSLQIVAAVSPDYIGRLYETSFIPVFLAGWDDSMTRLYLEKWTQAWERSQALIGALEPGDPVAGMELWKMWLALEPSSFTPLEFVLKVFGFSTNQIAGSTSLHAIQSYLRHATFNLPESILDTLEIGALYMLDQQRSVFSKKGINIWIKSAQQKGLLLVQEGKDSPFSRAIQIGLEKGFLVEIRPLQYSFAYQTFAGWFASRGLSKIDQGKTFLLG